LFYFSSVYTEIIDSLISSLKRDRFQTQHTVYYFSVMYKKIEIIISIARHMLSMFLMNICEKVAQRVAKSSIR